MSRREPPVHGPIALKPRGRHIRGMFSSELHLCVALRALGSRLQWTGGSRRLTPPAVHVSPAGLVTTQKTGVEKEQNSFRRSLRSFRSCHRLVSKEDTHKVSAGFMPAGPQLAATQMATERSPLSLRFIRREATFSNVSAFTCFRWHEANGELEPIGVSR